ncbi:MAG: hypothetical protein HRU15_07030 [Planctomycetes bacterium]|nr:hypothetical protein [Planctomycetota bacterium]
MLAAAQWHLEHNQAQAALELCETIRPLSNHADMAYLVGGIACLELNNITGALEACKSIMQPRIADNLILSIATHSPEHIANKQLMDMALHYTSDHAELFFTTLNILLQRKEIESARSVCFAQQETFLDHATIKQVMDVVLQRNCETPLSQG